MGCRSRQPALLCGNAAEVEQILEVPLAHLLDPANFGSHPRQYQGQTFEAPHFTYQSHRISGRDVAQFSASS